MSVNTRPKWEQIRNKPTVLTDASQTFNNTQKAQFRTNIDAARQQDLDDEVSALYAEIANLDSLKIDNAALQSALASYYTASATDTLLAAKQATLVSATNIKTINGSSILGAGDLTVSGGGGSSDMLSVLTASEISITGATTATIGRMHVCSGTSADYTVTLPAVSGNAGKFIGFRMSTALTKWVTIDGNASETIDGSLVRQMHDGESAILLCDGTSWAKVAGKTIPCVCIMAKATNQTGVAITTQTKYQVDTTIVDVGGFADTTNKRINIKRTGNYKITPQLRYISNSSGPLAANVARLSANVEKNGSFATFKHNGESSALAGAYPFLCFTSIAAYVAGDYVECFAYHAASTTLNLAANGTTENSTFCVEEVTPW